MKNRNSIIFLTLLVSTIIFVGCLDDGSEPVENNLEIVIYDSQTFFSIPETTVEVYDENQNLITQKQANDKGAVKFTLSNGKYFILTKKEGYEDLWEEFENDEKTKQVLDLELTRLNLCNEKWVCTDWSECKNGKQTRTCKDQNQCGTEYQKPEETTTCTMQKCEKDSDCDDNDPSTKDSCSGGTSCSHTKITSCIDDDGYCPSACNYRTDSDCNELDECTSSSECDDGNPCTEDLCILTPRRCVSDPITTCRHNDGCCPEDCEGSDNDCGSVSECDSDSDCTGICCDGNCEQPECETNSDCEDDYNQPCRTNYTCQNAGECNADCDWDTITECVDGDGCCPDGCSSDNDCGTCSNEEGCNNEGDTYCVSNENTVYTCGEGDDDECLDYINPVDCSLNDGTDNCPCTCGDYTEGTEDEVDCDDGIDNDCDSLTDEDDEDCQGPCVDDGEDCSNCNCNCCNECDPDGQHCFSCEDMMDPIDNTCEAECGVEETCDEKNEGELGENNDYCCSYEGTHCFADNAVGNNLCTCTSGNCAQGYCVESNTCYHTISCQETGGWDSTNDCDIDVCGENTLTVDRPCSGTGCGTGTTYNCNSIPHTCTGTNDYRACGDPEVNYYCTRSDSIKWIPENALPEENEAEGNCNDQIDNDCDGLTDEDDEGCGDITTCEDYCVKEEDGCKKGSCELGISYPPPPNCSEVGCKLAETCLSVGGSELCVQGQCLCGS